MSLSPLVFFKSRFVTYLLNFPRTINKPSINDSKATPSRRRQNQQQW